MKTSKKGIALIKKYEGFRPNAYKCPSGIWTIGWGSTFYANGKKVRPGDIISEIEADGILMKVVSKFEMGVKSFVKSGINQNQFDALVSFSYNVGLGAFSDSTLLKKINADPMDPDIAYQF